MLSEQLFEYLFWSNKNLLFLLWNATSARFLILLRGGSCIFQDTNFFDWNFPASKSNTLILCTCTFLFLSGPFSSAWQRFFTQKLYALSQSGKVWKLDTWLHDSIVLYRSQIDMSLRSLHCPKFDWSKKILEFQIFLDYKIKFRHNFLKFMYSEKATKVCEISTVDLSYVVTV